MRAIPEPMAIYSVSIDAGMLYLILTDGRMIGAPLTWFPRLLHATPNERNTWEVTPDRTGVHWPDVDEDISVRVLMGHPS